MKRKDIVLKNLAQEIKFGKHEFIRVNKIDRNTFGEQIELLDFDHLESLSGNLMEIIKDENKNLSTSEAYGTILLKGNCKVQLLLDILAKAFKAGNKVIVSSALNKSHTYQFLQKAWQSVLASQGYDSNHILFLEELNDNDLGVELCIQLEGLTNSNTEIELSNFTQGNCL